MTTAMLPIPSPEAVEEAKRALRTRSPATRNAAGAVRVHAGNADAIIPKLAFHLLLKIPGETANGNAVTIVPVKAELSTQQATDFLNVSRPYLIQLLEAEQQPYRKVGTHRRIRFEDLFAYKNADEVRRAGVLEDLAAEAQMHQMGY